MPKLIYGFLFLGLCFNVYSQDYTKAFPEADEGMVRHVLHLPQQNDESTSKVELIIGKTVLVDTVNHYFFSGSIVKETIPGWGFDRYILKTIGPIAGTLMAVPSAAAKKERFVRLRGEPYLLPYNSRLPLVVYVPQDVEVYYRIWNTNSQIKKIDKG